MVIYNSSFLASRAAASASSYILFFVFRGISSCLFLSSGEISSTFVSSLVSSCCFRLSSAIFPICSTTLSGFDGVAEGVLCSHMVSPFLTLGVTYCPRPDPRVGIARGELLRNAADEESRAAALDMPAAPSSVKVNLYNSLIGNHRNHHNGPYNSRRKTSQVIVPTRM